jgi:prophage regulatory protein
MEETLPRNRHERRRQLTILRKGKTAAKCGVVPRTIDRWASNPKYAHLGFPKPVKLGDNSIGFFEHEIESWLIRRAQWGGS